VESGSDALLKNMNKTARRKHYLEMIPKLRAAGISTHANLIVGFPGETT
jgi:tRNA A37 methylthiotransferase MiaB